LTTAVSFAVARVVTITVSFVEPFFVVLVFGLFILRGVVCRSSTVAQAA
jgi:hypothetical protein